MAAAFTSPSAERPLNEAPKAYFAHEKTIVPGLPENYLVSELDGKDTQYPMVFAGVLAEQREEAAAASGTSADGWDEKQPARQGGLDAPAPPAIENGRRHDSPTQDTSPPPSQRPQGEPEALASPWETTGASGSVGPVQEDENVAVDLRPAEDLPGNGSPHYDDSPVTIQGTGETVQQQQAVLPVRTISAVPQLSDSPVEVTHTVLDATMTSLPPSTPKHPAVPAARPSSGLVTDHVPAPIIPASAAPSYRTSPQPVSIPVSSNNRAYAQQPTYNAPAPLPVAVNPVYSPGPAVVRNPEEVCVECAMRDQDMADVDVTGPGVWDRESDIHYRELVRAEKEEHAELARDPDAFMRKQTSTDSKRPRARGDLLTEHNLKFWQSMNPREPQARQQTVDLYVRTQLAFLEAEGLAHARAMHESRVLENKVRDVYDHLRRSTHEAESESTNARIRKHRSSSGPSFTVGEPLHSRNPSRDITLLENGLVVEHVDVRKEAKEERERRKREERRDRSRVRKSSRSSAVDVTSMYSAHSPLPHPDSGFHTSLSVSGDNRPMSRFSQSSSRPMSVATNGMPLTPPPSGPSMRPSSRRLHSQVSLADTQSISSASMGRRSRFFGFKNLSAGWRSMESFAPSGMSGSMMDMHVALDHEKHQYPAMPAELGSNAAMLHGDGQGLRTSVAGDRALSPDKPKKKKGLSRLFRIFTGAKKHQVGSSATAHDTERMMDDLPLDPPPSLSYLVNRSTGDRSLSGPRHVATNSLLASPSSNRSSSVSPPTLPSSVLPTPTSVRHPWDASGHARADSMNDAPAEDTRYAKSGIEDLPRGLHPMLSEPNMRQRLQETLGPPPRSMQSALSPIAPSSPSSPRPFSVLSLDKSLPPLPAEAEERLRPERAQKDLRPHTVYTLESSSGITVGPSAQTLTPPQPAFRDGAEPRRQSFGGTTARPDMRSLPINGRRERAGTSASQNKPQLVLSEFGASRRSLGKAEDSPLQESGRRPVTPSKRRSKFLLGNLLGKGSLSEHRSSTAEYQDYAPSSTADMELSVEGSAASFGGRSRRSVAQPPPRMSVASRKAVEELVDQDPDFLAYRYPSVEQSLDVLR